METGVKILFVEDYLADAELAQQVLLKEGIIFQSRVVENEDDFINALENFVPDIVISDFAMPKFDGMKALKITLEKKPDIPVILLTGSIDESTAVECIKSGATDYIFKSHLSRLPFALLEALENKKALAAKAKVEYELKKTEEQYRLFVQNFHGIAFCGMINFKPVFFHGAVEEITGYTENEFLTGKLTWENMIHPDDLEIFYCEDEKKLHNVPNFSFEREYRIIHKDGQIRWVHEFIQSFADDTDMTVKLRGVIYDVTGRKHAEERLHKLNRELRAISICNQALAKAGDEQTLLDEICRIICQDAGYRLAWVGYAEDDEAKTIRPVAWAGFDSGYIANAKLTWSEDSKYGKGPAGTAIRSGEAIYVQDFLTDPLMVPWREIAVQRGYRSGIAIPLKDVERKVFGVLLIYSVKVNAITSDEVFLLTELAGDLAFGIITLRTHVERKRAEEKLEESEERYRLLFEVSADGILIADVETKTFKYANPALCKLLGYTKEQFATMGLADIHPKNDLQRVIGEFETAARREKALITDIPCLRQNGSIVYVEISSSGIITIDGRACMMGVFRDISERKQAEKERNEHLRFLESMERINGDIKTSADVENILSSVLNTTLTIFDCDRAWLVYPCDPDAPSFRVPVEVNKPEYPGANILNIEVPMSPGESRNMRQALESDEPVTYTAGTDKSVMTAEQFKVQSQMFISVNPKIGKPWIFGMHQCSHPRVWTVEEKQLFKEISRRVADALTSLLTFNKLKESEERFRRIAENARDVIYRMSLPDGKYEYVSPAALKLFGYKPEEFYETSGLFKQIIHPDWQKYFEEQWVNLIKGVMPPTYEYQIIHKSGQVRWINQRNILVRGNNGSLIAIEAIVTDITKRKDDEEALIQSELKKSELVDKLNDAQQLAKIGSWEWDLQTNLVWWSDQTYRVFGVTPNDYIPGFEANSKFIHPDDLDLYTKSFEHSLQTGEPLNVELRLITKNGISKYCKSEGKVISNGSGVPVRFIGTIMDVTERKLISENLKESEEYYRFIVETTNAVFYRLKYSTMKYEHLHPAIKKITGYTPEEINEIGFKNIVVKVTKYHVEEVNIDLIVEEREQGKTPEWQADYQVRTKDGKLIWLADHSYPWFNESGDLVGSIGFLIDITERKQAENDRKESEKKYEQIVETTMEGILSIDNKQEITFVNNRFAEMLGYEPKKIIGRKLDTYFFTEDLEDHKAKMIERQKGKVEVYERRFKRKDETILWSLISASPIYDDKGNFNGSIGMLADITQRKHNEEVRMREQLLLRTVIDNLPDAIYAKDMNGCKILTNLADLENIGAKNEAEILGKTDFDVFPEDVASKFFEDDQAVIQTGKPIMNREEFIIKADGQKHWLLTSKLPLKDEKGNISGLVGIGRDNTKRKQVEELLELNIERLDILLNIYQYNVQNIQDFLDFSLNEAIEITSSKVGYISFYDEEKREFILNSWSKEVMNEAKVTNPQACYELEKIGIWGEAIRQRKEIMINNFREDNPLKKGYPEGFVELTKYLTLPIFDDEKIVAVVSVANKESDYDEMDVMQLRLMMNSVWRIVKRKESEDKTITLSKAIEQNPVSIVITDPDGIIEYVNPSFEKLSGYSSSEVIGKTPRILKSGYHTGEFYKNLWATIKAGNDFRCEMKNRKKNGEFYWENTVLSPITNEYGKISHFIAVKEDITEKKKMIEELISSKEKAEEMSRLKSNFLANMSHELRTPLNGILGYADYLTSQLKDPELIETSMGIYDSGKRLSETLNFILDLSEAESEHIQILAADVDVIPLVKDTIRPFAKEAAKMNLRFETIIKEENIFAHIEERLFCRVLYNLLDNALKFTKKGIITFEIGKEVIVNREWFYFKVTDSGIGIAKDKIDVVWDEFRQVSEGLARTYEGVGLGLTISKKAVELMQGVITVESELGVGSTFTVEFPALSFIPKKEEEIQVKRIISQVQPAVFQPGKEKTGLTVLPLLLCIEDDFANRNVVKFFLKNSCNVETVASGEEALLLITEKKYDVILVDINLGEGMNGMAVVKEVRKMPGYADIPLIAVTAFAMENDKTEFLRGGFTHYISKPFKKQELIDLVTGALQNK